MKIGTRWQMFSANVALLVACVVRSVTAAEDVTSGTAQPQPNLPPLRIQVDPRVELLSLLFRLAGNPEYNQGKVESYTADVEKQFGNFRDHAAVKLAAQLRRSRGVSYDACMSMAVHVNNAQDLELLVPLDPWPDGLDTRWRAGDVNRFLEEARRFVKGTGFLGFVRAHQGLYQTTEARLEALMKQAHLEWFQEFFGQRAEAIFTVAPGLLNGGSCYGSRCLKAGGKDYLYCILGVWQIDSEGLPEFSSGMVSTVVHEFGHSYANPIIERHKDELRKAGDALFRPVADKMRAQAYSNGQTVLYESLVRVCEVRYAFRYNGPQAGRQAISYNKGRGFLWMQELSDLLGEYEAQRDKYPTLQAFAPRLVAFFNEYSQSFAEKQKALNDRRPKVVSMIPANGAADVDPSVSSFQVVFDRPMRDGSWSLVGGGPHCPESTGHPGYDASRTRWTVPVKLKPDRSYEFMLNSDAFDAFRSEEGVPLEPVHVTFKTKPAS